MPPPTLQVSLDQVAQAELERRYHTTRDAETRTRYQMVLLNAQGHTPPQIARLVRCSPDTVRRVLNRYLGGGLDAVPHRPHPGQPPHYPPGWGQELVRVADLDPHEVGVDSALWTCRLLADYLQGVTGHRAGIETVRIARHRAGFVCKRPRWVLTRKAHAQPGWAKTPEGGGAIWGRGLTGASTRRRPGSRSDPGRRPVPRGSAPPAGLLGHADLYLQDEVEVALHPTLTRVWSRAGRVGQRRVQAPGTNAKQYGFGLVDWRDGTLDFELADGRRAAPLCAQLRRAVARSRSRGRIAMVILDNLGIHTPKGSRLLRGLLAELGEDLVLVYTPTYDPDANRIEWLWRALRPTVTHTHRRRTLTELLADAQRWAHTITPAQVLSQIGSPFAPDQQPPVGEVLNHAA